DVTQPFDPSGFSDRLTSIVTTTESLGVVPILSTIPDNLLNGAILDGRVAAYNQVIADVAAAQDVPLWNYWLALPSLPNLGISADGVHPSPYPLGAGYLAGAGLQYGFNMRNLTAVEVLDKMLRVVINSGVPDPSSRPLNPEDLKLATNLYQAILNRPPDADGLTYWASELEAGLATSAVAQALWNSPEHRLQQVNRYYADFLHRTPAADEQAFWVDALRNGESEEDVQAAFLNSAEYAAAHPGSGWFVNGLYQDVLGWAPNLAMVAPWQIA